MSTYVTGTVAAGVGLVGAYFSYQQLAPVTPDVADTAAGSADTAIVQEQPAPSPRVRVRLKDCPPKLERRGRACVQTKERTVVVDVAAPVPVTAAGLTTVPVTSAGQGQGVPSTPPPLGAGRLSNDRGGRPGGGSDDDHENARHGEGGDDGHEAEDRSDSHHESEGQEHEDHEDEHGED